VYHVRYGGSCSSRSFCTDRTIVIERIGKFFSLGERVALSNFIGFRTCSALLIAICIFLASIGVYITLSYGLKLNDDVLWLIVNSHAFFGIEESTNLQSRVASLLFSQDRIVEASRFDLRSQSLYLYPIYSIVSRFFQLLLYPGLTANIISFEFYVSSVIICTSYAVSAVISLLVVFVVFVSCGNTGLFSLATLFALYAVSPIIELQYSTFYLMSHYDFSTALEDLFSILLKPGHEFSIFGYSGRSHFSLLLLAIFASRWSGMHVTAYSLALLGLFLHVPYGVMCISILGILDSLRGSKFCFVAIAIVCAKASVDVWISSRHAQGSVYGSVNFLPLAATLGIIVGVFCVSKWIVRSFSCRDPSKIRGITNNQIAFLQSIFRYDHFGRIEATLILLIFAFSFPVLFFGRPYIGQFFNKTVLNSETGPVLVEYDQFHVRIATMFLPAVLYWVFLCTIRWYDHSTKPSILSVEPSKYHQRVLLVCWSLCFLALVIFSSHEAIKITATKSPFFSLAYAGRILDEKSNSVVFDAAIVDEEVVYWSILESLFGKESAIESMISDLEPR